MIILFVYTVIFLHMCLIWIAYRYTNNPSVVDVGWASGLTLAGLLFLFSDGVTPRKLLMSIPLLIWGIRLAGYLLWTRILKREIDKRYIKLSEGWKIAKPLGFFLNFQLQGVLIWIISLSWYFSSLSSRIYPNFFDGLICFIFLGAILFETIADYQLQMFKAKKTGKVCDQQLWRYCRHPNYFFEWIVWCSFALFAFSSPYGAFAIVSPLTLYLIMTRVTGPMTEQGSIESKGDLYRIYQKHTPMFFPRIFR